ncbi:MAG: hypothetical protein VX475_21705, partial [Myxococcota bacterium]|nr:hypothetical protein [Myxococcota bacterium]
MPINFFQRNRLPESVQVLRVKLFRGTANTYFPPGRSAGLCSMLALCLSERLKKPTLKVGFFVS